MSFGLLLCGALLAGAAQEGPPMDWSTKEGSTRNVAWVATTGSCTIGRPVISDGLIWLGTDNQPPRDPSVKGDASVLACFRESDGSFVWQQTYARRSELAWEVDPPSIPHRCAPLIDGDRLWTVTNRWDVLCLDIGPLKRGGAPRELWKTDLIQQLKTSPCCLGMGYVPMLSLARTSRGKLFLPTGNGVSWKTRKIVNPEAPALVCLDGDTGKVAGRERSGISASTDVASWSSAVVARMPADGREIVLFGGGNGFLYAFEAEPDAEGTLKEIWKADCRRGKPDEPMGIVARPLVHEGRVYVSLGLDADADGGGNLGCFDLSTGRKIWDNQEYKSSLSDFVADGGRLFAIEYYGIINCFDAASGKKLWSYDTLSIIVPSPLLVDGRLIVCNGDDEVMILDVRSPVAKPTALKRELEGCSGATPSFFRGTLYIPSRKKLFAIRETESRTPASSSPALKRGRAADAVFLPTPQDIVREMLQLAELTDKDVLYDLGSGDGRIVISAAVGFKCKAVGIEIDADLVASSRDAIRGVKLEDRVRIEHEDLLKADFSSATVVTLYIGDRLSRDLMPKLRALKPGVRIVSHRFPLPGVKPARSLTFRSTEDGRDHELFLYKLPLETEKK
jgi:outer membrane protein assembly factor BamB